MCSGTQVVVALLLGSYLGLGNSIVRHGSVDLHGITTAVDVVLRGVVLCCIGIQVVVALLSGGNTGSEKPQSFSMTVASTASLPEIEAAPCSAFLCGIVLCGVVLCIVGVRVVVMLCLRRAPLLGDGIVRANSCRDSSGKSVEEIAVCCVGIQVVVQLHLDGNLRPRTTVPTTTPTTGAPPAR